MNTTTTETTDTTFHSPGSEYPPSRPGIRFAVCVSLAVLAVLGYIIFG